MEMKHKLASLPAKLAELNQRTHQKAKGFRPFFFHPCLPEESTALAELVLQKQTVLQVFDRLENQLQELIKAKNPGHNYSPSELAEAVRAKLAGAELHEYGVWVYYPWSERLVHLLDEAEFVELRTNRNLYKITQKERQILSRKKIGIIGLSVGQSIGLTIAMERSFGEIRLADYDTLELSNLNRIRTGLHNLGIAKTVAAAREIAEIDPFLKVECFEEGVNDANLDQFLLEGGKLDILVDECDSLDVKVLARYRARELGIPVVMDTSDRGMLDVERFDLEPSRPLFHGLAGEIDPASLKNLTNEEKVPFVFSILGIENLSERLRTSMLEVGKSLLTWPQLASGVVLGGAVSAEVCRQIALDYYHSSGRFYIDLEELLKDKPVVQTL